jgi:release factor glutamine methyltransferase
VLVPRPETEILVERTIDLVRKVFAPPADPNQDPEPPAPRILDLCTGSGCIAVALAKNLPNVSVFASDLSEQALAIARRNAARHGLSERIEFRAGDLFAPWPEERFDLIVSNPPYIGLDEAPDLPANVRDYEPHAALFAGPEGLSILERIAREAVVGLNPGGFLLMEMGYRQSAAVRGLLEAAGWGDIVTFRDHLQHERVAQARKKN